MRCFNLGINYGHLRFVATLGVISTSLVRDESLRSLSGSSATTLLSLVRIDEDFSLTCLLLWFDCDEASFGC